VFTIHTHEAQPPVHTLSQEREMLAYCKHNGIGVIPWAPLASGVLARPLGTETTRLSVMKGTAFEKKIVQGDATIINRVEELAKKKNCKMSQIALAWVVAKVESPIVGANSVQRLQESIVKGIELTPEEMTYLEEPCAPFLVNRHEIDYSFSYRPKVVRGHL
jgi:aryl-alcohol dehydrogenase-like predicted oxidoreductase